MRTSRLAATLLAVTLGGCKPQEVPAPPVDLSVRDRTPAFEPEDLASFDLDDRPPPTPCGDRDPACQTATVEPPFPLLRDPKPDPRAYDKGLARNGDGALVLAQGATTGTYRYLFSGCRDVGDTLVDTPWYRLLWESDVPAGTAVRVRAASGPFASDPGWGAPKWTPWFTSSPMDLQQHLDPNLHPDDPNGTVVNDQRLLVEIELTSESASKSPTLKRLVAAYKCWVV